MKFGSWIQMSAILLSGIAASESRASVNQDKLTLSEEEFLEAIKKVQSEEMPVFKQSTPCYSSSSTKHER